ncbi:MAG TPA: enoyl-CoA hydratase-related protein [Bacillus sp. (in: firmicutes)]|uniref:enoyl-CoA hydratase/isomerase family protein n=1 Tax=Bacillus litorisediminis TaxID=2922713 RepID=UPI001FAB4174|nr:enoyl-CoA hydratase-related protein [Bacillus litorisediminis]HWO74702.1 enoyl-CoA hydratase-related protein [Bacillus sp. (in: firmicutes)]
MTDLLFEVEGNIAKITLNRPESMNAFSKEMIDLWIKALIEIRDNDDIHIGIVTGNGRAFCAGGDVKSMINKEGFLSKKDTDDIDFRSTPLHVKNSLWKNIQRIPLLMEEIDKPMIAVINGHAMGAGLDMALMCDIRIASDQAKLGETYINAGIVPGDGGGYYLPRIVGLDKALEMFWTAKVLSADEAFDLKLVSHVVPHNQLERFTNDICNVILSKSQEVIQMTKRIVKESQTMTLKQSLDYVSSQMAISVFHEGHEQAMNELSKKFIKA